MDVYGLKNCDTCRKALKWLDDSGLAYKFHDIRQAGLGETEIADWAEKAGWEALLNRRGTTWRRLPEPVRAAVKSKTAEQLMLEHPAIIRRPVLEHDGRLYAGFSSDSYQAIFGAAGKT